MSKQKKEDIKKIVQDTLTGLLLSKWKVSARLAQDLDIEIPPQFQDPKLNPGLKVTPLQLILAKMVEKACQGNDKAIQEMLDRTLGKAAQHIETKSTVTYLDFVTGLADTIDDVSAPFTRVSPDPTGPTANAPEIPVNFDAVHEEDELLDELDSM